MRREQEELKKQLKKKHVFGIDQRDREIKVSESYKVTFGLKCFEKRTYIAKRNKYPKSFAALEFKTFLKRSNLDHLDTSSDDDFDVVGHADTAVELGQVNMNS